MLNRSIYNSQLAAKFLLMNSKKKSFDFLGKNTNKYYQLVSIVRQKCR